MYDDAPWPPEPTWPVDPWAATPPAPSPQRWSPLPSNDEQPNEWDRLPEPPHFRTNGYGSLPGSYPTPRWDTPTQFMPPTAPTEHTVPHAHPSKRRLGWSLPVEHLVLAAGFIGMLLALSQPWGNDARGHVIMLGPTATRVAYDVLGGFAVLGGLLVLLNRRMGCLAFAGCLMLFALPILAAASLGGFAILTQLHVVPHLSPANIQGVNRGFFLWWGGLAMTIVGLLLEIVTHRRKGIIGM